MSEPQYRLIQTIPGEYPCPQHKDQQLTDLYNSPEWKMQVVGIDKIKFNCQNCGSERVYLLLPEKTLL